MSLPFDVLSRHLVSVLVGGGESRGASRRRHVWAAPGRAHIDVRGVHRPGTEGIADAVERALLAIEGVHWAEVNAILARVAVAFDDDVVDIDDLITAIEAAEDDFGLGAGDLLGDRPDHPGDADAIRWGAVEVGADIAGIALGGITRFLRWPVLPVEIAAALPAIDSLPPVRRVLDIHRGIEAAVVSTSAVLQGLGAGPVGLVVDATHRVTLLGEAMARRAVWERAEVRLHPGPSDDRVAAVERSSRPVPLPDGPLETYAQRVAFGSLGAGGLAFVLTGNPRRAVDVLLAAVPRAARLGRESFAASAGRALAGRDVVPMDARVLRRLDRIDTVVVDAELLDEPTATLRALLDAVHAAAQDLVIAGTSSDGARVADADLVVAGGAELAGSVRGLQTEGRVVAVVSARSGEALAAADCGIGLCRPGARPPWGAHLLCPTLYDAGLVVEATAVARTASSQAVRIAMAGSAVAAVLALGPLPLAGRRALLADNAAALTAIAVGTWTGASLNGRPQRGDDREPVMWHALSGAEVVARLGTNAATGLDVSEAESRRVDIPEDRHATFGELFVKELSNPLTVLLGVGGVLSTVAGSFGDGLLISGVLGVNACIGAAQRLRTEKAIRRLTASVSSQGVRIRRDGSEVSTSPSELVAGDVVLLQAGDIVPADSRIVMARGVETDESALTGESLPVAKHADAVAPDTAVADRTSIAYAGTAIAAGRAEAVVVATGHRTEAGRAAADGGTAPVTGVEARLDDITRRTVPLVLAAGATLTGITLLRGGRAREAISTGVSLAAAAVPEGLPFLATVAQSGAARRLSTKGVLVRNPRVLEALGRADVLCFDKTGTLTEGQLQLRSVSDGDIVETLPAVDGRRRLVLAAALRATPHRRREGLPHPTDQAVVDGADAIEVGTELGAVGWHDAASLPFASTRGYHAVLGHAADGPVLSVKGAPEVVLPRCASLRQGDHVTPLDDTARARLERHVEHLAHQGLRVLAVAERDASGRADLDDERVERLELVGFVTVSDVARSSAIAPIAQLQHAGISVVMLTGDHPSTAAAIASELGLLDGDVISGADLDTLDDDQLDALVDDTTVFARVTPAQKVRIVQAFQRRGRTVAMAGDGANDAQAIRLADIGIAFGPRATSAARGAADLVVVDDRVETLITSIIEGRAMWASVRDALALLLGGNLGEVIFTTGATLLSGRSPLNARQLLAVNLLTDLAPAMAIALQPPLSRDIDLRREGPDTSLGSRLVRDIALRAAATSAGAYGAWTIARFTGTPTRARTVALAALVGSQLGQTIMIGHRSPLVLASGLVSIGALTAIVQTPGLSQFFGCRPLGPIGWTIAAGAATAATAGAIVGARLLDRADHTNGTASSANPRENATVVDLTTDTAVPGVTAIVTA